MRAVIAATVVMVAILAGLLAPPALLGGSLFSGRASAGGASIGIDADPTGNAATLLDTTDTCIAVVQGDSFQVDVIARDVTDLLAWEAYLSFDGNLLQVTDRNVQQFLASIPEGDVFDLSESVPDDDGIYRVGAASISDRPQGGSGSGVLARVSLQALGPGLATLSLAPVETEVGTVEATLTAADGSRIGDSDDNGFYDGPAEGAKVAIDQSCPAASAASILGGSLSVWLLLVLALGAAVTGGLAVLARRRIS